MIRFIPLKSNKLVGLKYNPTTQQVVAQFDEKTYYRYKDVSPEDVTRTLFPDDGSFGKAFIKYIERGRQFDRITADEAYQD